MLEVMQLLSKTETVFHFLVHIPITTKLLTFPTPGPSPEVWVWLLERSWDWCPAQEPGRYIRALSKFPVTDHHALQPSRPHGNSAHAIGCLLVVNTAFLRTEDMQAGGSPYCCLLPSQPSGHHTHLMTPHCPVPTSGLPSKLTTQEKESGSSPIWVPASLLDWMRTSPKQGFC